LITILTKLHKGIFSRKKKKFRILLDSAFAKPDLFPKIKKRANVVHVVHNLGLPFQAEDEEIYQKATKENRFILTINFDDFKKLVKKGGPGIIGIESQLSNEQIDTKVYKFLANKDPKDFIGKATKI